MSRLLGKPSYPWQASVQLEQHGRFFVVRDDLLPGGSKTRFLPHVIGGEREVVYGSPFCGGAGPALAFVGRELGVRVTLFYAARNELHWKQRLARDYGARLELVPAGRMSVVQARAREYCQRSGARHFPLGFDVPEAEAPFVAAMRTLGELPEGVTEAWCATGSGMLARCLAKAFPELQIHAVAVGLRSRWEKQAMPPNVTIHESGCRFEEEARRPAPFPSCPNYDRKAWHAAQALSRARGALFWNVQGDGVEEAKET